MCISRGTFTPHFPDSIIFVFKNIIPFPRSCITRGACPPANIFLQDGKKLNGNKMIKLDKYVQL